MTQTAIRLEEPGRFGKTEDRPAEPVPGEARVRIRRIGVCGTDIHAFRGRQPFFEYPRVLGHELAAEILSLPDEANAGDPLLRPGRLVAVEPYLNDPDSPASRRGRTNCCESLRVLGVHCDGGMRPEMNVPVRKLHGAASASADQLALVEMLSIGCHAVHRSRVDAAERALVLGAGPIGLSVLTFLQRHTQSIAVADLDEGRLGFCREAFGVDCALRVEPDRPLEPEVRDAFGGELPDLVFDATGNGESMRSTFELAAHGGRIVFVGLFPGEVAFDDPDFHRRELTLLASRNAVSREFDEVIAAIESGAVDTSPWVTHRLDLAEVPARFAGTIEDPALQKAVIDVDD